MKLTNKFLYFLSILSFFLLHSHQVVFANESDGLRITDHYISHKSIEPFYEKHNLDPTVTLHVREIVLAGRERTISKNGKVLLMIHGATFPGSVAFDLDYENVSMMRQFAKLGWDTFALDLEGYGMSTRPASMDNPDKYSTSKAPISPEVTVADVARSVDFIRNLRNVDKVSLLGWSAGAMLEAPMYAIENPEKVAKLVLYGTNYLGKGKPKSAEEMKKIVKKRHAKKNRYGDPSNIKRWVKLGTKEEYLIPGAFAAYTKAHLASDPKSKDLGGRIRAPWGRFIGMSRPKFDAAMIKVPTLIIRGESDAIATKEDNQALLDNLGSEIKQLVDIVDAGHMIQFEKKNVQFYTAIQNFLEN